MGDSAAWWSQHSDGYADEYGNVYIVASTLAFDWGLRFPMYSFMEDVYCHFNICLMQSVPQSYRHLTYFIFLCDWFNFPLTMNLFQSYIKLKRAIAADSGF